MGGVLPFSSLLFFFGHFVFTVRRERKQNKRFDGLGKSLWSSIEVGAQQQKEKALFKPFVTIIIIIIVATCNDKIR